MGADVRGRLIIRSKLAPPWPSEICGWPSDSPPPPGWEEFHVERPAPREQDGPPDADRVGSADPSIAQSEPAASREEA